MGLQWQYALVTLVHQIIHSIHILMKTSVQCLYKRNSAQTIGEEGGGGGEGNVHTWSDGKVVMV